MRCWPGDESQRHGVQAVAKTGRLGSVREDMSPMRVAQGAFDFRSQHPRAEVFFLAHICCGDCFPKALPASAGVEFRPGIEKRVAAINAAVESRRVLIVERTGKGEFRRRPPRYIVFERGEPLLPFGPALPHFRQV